ncbi:hypothetical protein SFMTTN_1038 [Sulfuriferula multivorans]|uniref:Uncharacterized protein n=1 Tax=Sulfuriferula multivorans TaxID=1559896 RepID=A0A401JC50_9PROT|nr:hypothetical protein SFMTTN_1038 [Sulfuriferula multivorans]
MGIAAIKTAQARCKECSIPYATCENAYMIQRWTQGMNPGSGNKAVAGFVSYHPAISCRTNDGTNRLCAKSSRYTACGNCGGRSARRTARGMPKIPWIAGFSGMAPGELGSHCFAHHKRACSVQELNNSRGLRRDMPGIDGRSHRSGHPPGRDNVFHSRRDTVQTAGRPPVRQLTVGFTGALECELRIQPLPRLNLVLQAFRPDETGASQLFAGKTALAYPL